MPAFTPALLATRVHQYHRDLKRFHALQVTVAQPYFNATREANVLAAHDRLSAHLRVEAEALFASGVNVYVGASQCAF